MANPADSVSNLDKLLQSSGLNEDCLTEIFKYLDACDLLQMCYHDDDTDKSITNFVNDYHILNEKLVDFKQIQSQQNPWSVNRVFEYFGHSMRRIKVC